MTATVESGQWLDQFAQLDVAHHVFDPEPTALLIEVAAETNGVVCRGVPQQLMEQEGVVMFLEQGKLHVSVAKFLHVSRVSAKRRVQLEIFQAALAHEEDWEVIIDLL